MYNACVGTETDHMRIWKELQKACEKQAVIPQPLPLKSQLKIRGYIFKFHPEEKGKTGGGDKIVTNTDVPWGKKQALMRRSPSQGYQKKQYPYQPGEPNCQL